MVIFTSMLHLYWPTIQQHFSNTGYFWLLHRQEKPEAVAIIDSCNINTKLTVLSLVKSVKRKFPFATDQEVNNGLALVQNYRQTRKMSSLYVIW